MGRMILNKCNVSLTQTRLSLNLQLGFNLVPCKGDSGTGDAWFLFYGVFPLLRKHELAWNRSRPMSAAPERAGPASQALHARAAVLQAILTLPAIGLCNHTSFKSSVAFVPRVAKLQRTLNSIYVFSFTFS